MSQNSVKKYHIYLFKIKLYIRLFLLRFLVHFIFFRSSVTIIY